MVKCTFCNSDLVRGTGKMFVYKTGKIAYFCTRKCEKNLIKLNRKPQDFKWTRPKKKKA